MFLLVFSLIAKAQTYTWSSTNDYNGVMVFDKVNSFPSGLEDWEWGEETDVTFGAQENGTAFNSYPFQGQKYQNNVRRGSVVGPGYNKTVTFTIYKKGLGCTSPAIYGSCVTESKSRSTSHDVLITTAPLKAPEQLYVFSGAELNSSDVTLVWKKTSSVPGNYLDVEILDNGNTILTIPFQAQSADDTQVRTISNLEPNIKHVFTVRLKLNAKGVALWGAQTSTESNAVTKVFIDPQLAQDADNASKVLLTWKSLGTVADDVRVFRGDLEIANLNVKTASYTDRDGTPGKTYTYGLVVESNGFTQRYDIDGGRKSIGKITGTVRSTQGAGVPNITITATTTIQGKPYSYQTTTDASGYYELRELYYGDQRATFTITPSYAGHSFNVDNAERLLDVNGFVANSVDFTDNTVLSIGGKLLFATNNEVDVNLPVKDAQIFLDGKDTGIKTDEKGEYVVSVFEFGNHQVEAKFKAHNIVAVGTQNQVATVNIAASISNLDFSDLQTDTLTLRIQGPCNAPIGEYVNVSVKDKNNQWIKKYTVNAANGLANNGTAITSGIKEIVLPATDFTAEITNVFVKASSSGSAQPDANKTEYYQINYGAVAFDLSERAKVTTQKTTTQEKVIPAKTVTLANGKVDVTEPERKETVTTTEDVESFVKTKLDFIYHRDLEVVSDEDDVFKKVTVAGKQSYLLSQFDNPELRISLKEAYSYDGVDYGCVIKADSVLVYDGISDLERQRLLFEENQQQVKYKLKAGAPVIEAPYEKTLQLVAFTDGKTVSKVITAIVEGERARIGTFVTKSPEIPLFVLHDPPGDGSSVSIAKGTVISKTKTTSYQVGGSSGAYVETQVGAGTVAPFIGALGADVHFQTELSAGRDDAKGRETNTTITFEEGFSTSADETLVGGDGDVFIGASLNMQFAVTDVLKYDAQKQEFAVTQSLGIDYTGYNSTYAYTQKHIKDVVIPQLEALYQESTEKFNAALAQNKAGNQGISADVLTELNKRMLENKAGLDAWKKAIEKNEEVVSKAKTALPDDRKGIVDGNISFSAGVGYDNSYTVETSSVNSTEFSVYVDNATASGAGVRSGDFNEFKAGALLNVSSNDATGEENGTTNSQTIAFHLEDNDIGDYFSVGLYKDEAYNTPIFKVVAGASSCPYEDGTQFRHLPEISVVGSREQRNVPASTTAKFKVNVANRSESGEAVEYNIKLDPASNLGGATVTVGGQDVTNGLASYIIPAGKSFELDVEVTKGPSTSTYQDLQLFMFSSCDNTLDDIDEKAAYKPSVKLSAYFQSECGSVDLFTPGNNWIVNKSNNNELFVAFSKYDASEGSPLTKVSLQYRRRYTSTQMGEWTTVVDVAKSDLKEKYYNYTFNVANLIDGEYELRALAICGGIDVNYSPVYSGKIDRTTTVAFGVPSPKNGLLTRTDEVSVDFNRAISCGDLGQGNFKLQRVDNGEVLPAKINCSGNRVVISTIPESLIDDYEGVELKATLQGVVDNNGNQMMDELSWKFVVNRVLVAWDPVNVNLQTVAGQEASFYGKLRNKSAVSAPFTLIKVPSWITPSATSGVLKPQGEFNISFGINPGLDPYEYIDTIVVASNGNTQNFYLDIDVLKEAPKWTVDPTKFKYSMNFVAQFSTKEAEDILSKDNKDKIAVFVGDECRGVGNIQYDVASNSYVGFLTAYANTTLSDKLTFRMWDAKPGVEYLAKEEINFVANSIIGKVSDPIVFHPKRVVQTIPLKKGWNYISLNLIPDAKEIPTLLNKLKSTEGDLVKGWEDGKYAQYSSTIGWAGSLKEIDPFGGYMISVAKDDTLRIVGQYDVAPKQIAYGTGWHMVGYPMTLSAEVNQYFRGVALADGDVLKSQSGFAQYQLATKTWAGSLKYLKPNESYRLYTKNTVLLPVLGGVDFESPKAFADQLANIVGATQIDKTAEAGITSTIDPNLILKSGDFDANMSITAVIRKDGKDIVDVDQYEVQMLIDGQVTSIGNLTSLPNGRSVAFIPVFGQDSQLGKNVQVFVYNKTDKTRTPVTLTNVNSKGISKKVLASTKKNVGNNTLANSDFILQDDGVLGTISDPKVIVVPGKSDVALTLAVKKADVNLGEEFTYTITVENKGVDPALNFSVADQINELFEIVNVSDSRATYTKADGAVSLTLPVLAVGEKAVLEVTLKAKAIGTAEVGHPQITFDFDDQDSDQTNNVAAPKSVTVKDARANADGLFIPQLISPNGDGINDLFVIGGLYEYYAQNTLIIYNSRYDLVYRKVNYQNDWSAQGLPKGSYGYELKVKQKDGQEKVVKGFVTVVY